MSDPPDDWADRLRASRGDKDSFFAEHPQSPIPPDDRDDFDGLDYYEPDPAYRVEATVEVYDDPEPVELDTSDDRTVRYHRAFSFAFDLDGERRRVHGYTQERDERESIFVPIADETTGEETYGGGRYMELEPETDLEDGDVVTLDFNLAYTPFCAFSETFSCPLPPEENHLTTRIEAGEREM